MSGAARSNGSGPGGSAVAAAEAREQATERGALRLSALAAALIAVVGIVWGLASESSAVLLDGAYALIGTLPSLLTLRAARLVAAGPTERYPFGREALGPVMIGIQGVALLGTLLYAAIDAVLTLVGGGSEADVASALVYSVLSMLLSLALLWAMRRAPTSSELVAADATQWAAGSLLSAAMVAGFGVAVVLQRTGAEELAELVDPVLVLLAVVLLVRRPLLMIRSTVRELLEGAPGPDVELPVTAAVAEVATAAGLPEPTMRLGKVGRKLYVELDFLVPPGQFEVGDGDVVRRAVMRRLAEPGRLLWVNVELHTDPAWDG